MCMDFCMRSMSPNDEVNSCCFNLNFKRKKYLRVLDFSLNRREASAPDLKSHSRQRGQKFSAANPTLRVFDDPCGRGHDLCGRVSDASPIVGVLDDFIFSSCVSNVAHLQWPWPSKTRTPPRTFKFSMTTSLYPVAYPTLHVFGDPCGRGHDPCGRASDASPIGVLDDFIFSSCVSNVAHLQWPRPTKSLMPPRTV